MAGFCGECTGCCTVFEIKELQKEFGKPCQHLSKTPPGCGIYTDRPTPCSGYVCLWLDAARTKDRQAPEEMRPDVCGVVLGQPFRVEHDVLHVFPIPGHPKYPDAWRYPPISDHLQGVLKRGGRLMIFVEGKRIAIRGDMAVIGTEEEFEKLSA